MAITDFNAKDRPIQVGNRNDMCYMCQCSVTGKNEQEYMKKMRELKGKLEGKPVLKIKRNGVETAICMPCLHKIAKENPIVEE